MAVHGGHGGQGPIVWRTPRPLVETQGRLAAAAVGGPIVPVGGARLVGEGFVGSQYGGCEGARTGLEPEWMNLSSVWGAFTVRGLLGESAKWAHPSLGHGPAGGACSFGSVDCLVAPETRWRVPSRCPRPWFRDRRRARTTRRGPSGRRPQQSQQPPRIFHPSKCWGYCGKPHVRHTCLPLDTPGFKDLQGTRRRAMMSSW